MTNRRKIFPTIIAVALVALFLPVMASAQGNYDPWSRNRRNDDRYGYNNRSLRDTIRRVDDRADDFRSHLDSALDRSRYDDTRREDRINNVAREFENAASRLRDRFGDGRDLNRSAGEAQRLLQIGSRIDQLISRNRFDGRVMSDWAQIRQDLRVIANAYNNRGYYGGNGGYNGNDGYYGNDDYRRREEQRRREEEQRRRQNRSRIGSIIRNLPY